MTRKPGTTAFWYGRLPHWEVVDGRYFVTIHLSGAIPEAGRERIYRIAAKVEQLPENDDDGRLNVQRRVFREMEEWLDRAEFITHLQQPEIAQMVMEAIAYRQGRIWNMFEFVVMPTHLHLFFELLKPGLKYHLEEFKRWTGHRAAKILHTKGERFWQDEWFDHWSRSDEEDVRIEKYIQRNPEKAALVECYLQWAYGGWASRSPRSGE